MFTTVTHYYQTTTPRANTVFIVFPHITAFVFLALLEFTVVNYLWRKECCRKFRQAKAEHNICMGGLGNNAENLGLGRTPSGQSMVRAAFIAHLLSLYNNKWGRENCCVGVFPQICHVATYFLLILIFLINICTWYNPTKCFFFEKSQTQFGQRWTLWFYLAGIWV